MDTAADEDTRLDIATVQGLVRRVLFADPAEAPPVDAYDCILVDEAHRGYALDRELSEAELTFRSEADYVSKYRRLIDHFDAVKIGLTATPAQYTTEIFGRAVYQYSYRQAVIDGWLERIAQQMIRETVVDRPALDSEQFKAAGGGFKRLDKIFENRLEEVVGELHEEVWRDAG